MHRKPYVFMSNSIKQEFLLPVGKYYFQVLKLTNGKKSFVLLTSDRSSVFLKCFMTDKSGSSSQLDFSTRMPSNEVGKGPVTTSYKSGTSNSWKIWPRYVKNMLRENVQSILVYQFSTFHCKNWVKKKLKSSTVHC